MRLQLRVPEAVDQCIDLLPLLAKRAFVRGVRGVILKVIGVKDGAHGKGRAGFLRGKDRADARNVTAVIVDRLDGGLRGIARGYGGGQDQHVLTAHGGHRVVAEDQLAPPWYARG